MMPVRGRATLREQGNAGREMRGTVKPAGGVQGTGGQVGCLPGSMAFEPELKLEWHFF